MARERRGEPRKPTKVGDLKKATAKRARSAKKDLPARKAGGVTGGVERAGTQTLPYIEQNNPGTAAGLGAGPHVKAFSNRDGTGL